MELCRELLEGGDPVKGEVAEMWPLLVKELGLERTPMRVRFSVEGPGVKAVEGLSEERYEDLDGREVRRYVHEQVCDMKHDVACADMAKGIKWAFRVYTPVK